MHIKEIEIKNFKSFNRARIPFYEDFTTISGPNGSGKSNIIDAIIFALGLSSSRTMRAERLTDLINSSNGDNLKISEVSIKFDNVDRRDAKQQLAVFQTVQHFRAEYNSFCILSLRDETYDRFQHEPPLDAFFKPFIFRITPPKFIDVIKKAGFRIFFRRPGGSDPIHSS